MQLESDHPHSNPDVCAHHTTDDDHGCGDEDCVGFLHDKIYSYDGTESCYYAEAAPYQAMDWTSTGASNPENEANWCAKLECPDGWTRTNYDAIAFTEANYRALNSAPYLSTSASLAEKDRQGAYSPMVCEGGTSTFQDYDGSTIVGAQLLRMGAHILGPSDEQIATRSRASSSVLSGNTCRGGGLDTTHHFCFRTKFSSGVKVDFSSGQTYSEMVLTMGTANRVVGFRVAPTEEDCSSASWIKRFSVLTKQDSSSTFVDRNPYDPPFSGSNNWVWGANQWEDRDECQAHINAGGTYYVDVYMETPQVAEKIAIQVDHEFYATGTSGVAGFDEGWYFPSGSQPKFRIDPLVVPECANDDECDGFIWNKDFGCRYITQNTLYPFVVLDGLASNPTIQKCVKPSSGARETEAGNATYVASGVSMAKIISPFATGNGTAYPPS